MNKNSKLENGVEHNETYIGGVKKDVHGRSAKRKTLAFGTLQRKGKLKANVVDDCKSKQLTQIIQETIKADSDIMTNKFLSYN